MRTLKITAALVMTTYIVACSPVKFDKKAEVGSICGADGVACVTQCEGEACFDHITVSKTSGQQQVDILVVNDNSGSMSPEQAKMGSKFPTFISSLGSLNYRIAMTTTDISDGTSYALSETKTMPPNQGSSRLKNVVQDGNLITFGNGAKFLEGANGSASSMNESYFNQAVKREETLTCEQSNYANCPSNDERGVFAATLAIEKNESSFLRPIAHLAVIILSDEDERGISDSRSAKNSNDQALINLYKRENYDLPATLLSKFKTKYPGKSISVHPIIVRPGDSSCLNTQTVGNIRGVEGYTYSELFSLTGGTMGSICESDYGSTLTEIGNYVQKESISLPFQCRPVNDAYEITFTKKDGTKIAQDVDVEADFDKLTLRVISALPPETTAKLSYKCKK